MATIGYAARVASQLVHWVLLSSLPEIEGDGLEGETPSIKQSMDESDDRSCERRAGIDRSPRRELTSETSFERLVPFPWCTLSSTAGVRLVHMLWCTVRAPCLVHGAARTPFRVNGITGRRILRTGSG
jgi:hypothetical protein